MSTKIISFDKNNARALHEEMLALLAPLAEKYGVRIVKAGGSIGTDKCKLNVEFIAQGEDAEKMAFAKNCDLFHCKAEDYGRIGLINGKKVKLVGFEPGRSKFCVRGYCIEEQKVMLYTREALRLNWEIESCKLFGGPVIDPVAVQAHNDAFEKSRGYTHRLNAWIHPEAGGSDYQRVEYFKAQPTPAEIARVLTSSCVKDDFKVTAL